MNNQRTAVLIEATSIQQYIFSSNKLKENIGASYIIEKMLYGESGLMDKILKDAFGKDFNINLWKEAKDLDKNSSCEVGFIGGGNMLIFFGVEDNAKNCIAGFTKSCLVEFPGLRVSIGIKTNFDISNYKDEYRILLQDLKERKAKYIPNDSIPKHGITADCPLSNETAEVFEKKSGIYISMASASKLEASEKSPKKYKYLDKGYILPDEIDKLGQNKEASYIAVVHIDGNGMGKIFSKINDIKELRKKSNAVSDKANGAMIKLIEHIIQTKESGEFFDLKFDDKMTLPFRPILVGGDDVTFICEGRLGVYLAEKFIEYFFDKSERHKEPESADKLMDGACAGVAIVKSHFPFYKAVKLAEELCSEAKKVSRKKPGSYISYYYSATTFSGTLEELRAKTHETKSGNMYYGPYVLFENNNQSLEKLKQGILYFKQKWPKNKVMQLRDIIADSISAQKLFEKEITEIGLKFPQSKTTIWANNQTAFFDQIELMDFYLDNLLNPTL